MPVTTVNIYFVPQGQIASCRQGLGHIPTKLQMAPTDNHGVMPLGHNSSTHLMPLGHNRNVYGTRINHVLFVEFYYPLASF